MIIITFKCLGPMIVLPCRQMLNPETHFMEIFPGTMPIGSEYEVSQMNLLVNSPELWIERRMILLHFSDLLKTAQNSKADASEL